MAHSLSAKKRVRQNLKHRARNRARKAAVRSEVKTFMTTLGAGDMKKAEEALRKAVAVMDRVAVKGTIHKNAASRRRRRLPQRLNVAKAGAASGKGTAAAKA